MSTKIQIRRAVLSDNIAISNIIIETIQKKNAKDYSSKVIEDLTKNFSPDRITEHINTRQVFIALEQNKIVGTASLENVGYAQFSFYLKNKG